jgi:hypothetical protein
MNPDSPPTEPRKSGNTFATLALDAGLAASLLVAVLVVLGVDWFRPPRKPVSDVVEPPRPVKVEPAEPVVPVKPLRLGVTPARPEFDDMGRLLNTLGEGYKFTGFPLDDLGDAKKISEYNIIFITCSGIAKSWCKRQIGDAARPGYTRVEVDEPAMKRAAENLSQFVGRGGTLYVSDLHFNLVQMAFPDFVDHEAVDIGKPQTVEAEVVDPALREIIGPKLSLKFDQPEWRPAAFSGTNVTTFIRGAYESARGRQATAPLLVKFPYKDGTVIFTSFHNEKQNDKAELKLLRHLVFATVTAGEETRVAKTMVQGGFQPAKRGIFSASQSEPSVTQTYHCSKEGELQFVLGFSAAGAKLRLDVVGPDGQKFSEEGTATLTVKVPKAVPGDWNYTVTALKLPNDNFAYTVTVGEK